MAPRWKFAVSRSSVPWRNGKADHFTFEPRTVRPTHTAARRPQVQHKPVAAPKAGIEHLWNEASTVPINDWNCARSSTLPLMASSRSMPKARFLDFRAGAEAIFGYRHAEVVGPPFDSLLNPESAASLREYLAGLEGQGLASVFNDGREVIGVVKQGGSVPLFLNIGRLQTAQSAAVFCAVVRDITNWKRTERELRDAKDAAEQASRHKSEFLARVSHELRTPAQCHHGFFRNHAHGPIRRIAQ